MTEATFQAWVLAECARRDLLTGHDPDSRRQTPGEPDLYIIGTRLVWVELKAPRGILRDEQRRWHTRAVSAGAEVYIWAPGDEAEILRVLDTLALAPVVATYPAPVVDPLTDLPGVTASPSQRLAALSPAKQAVYQDALAGGYTIGHALKLAEQARVPAGRG
jgi:hypothetical protein